MFAGTCSSLLIEISAVVIYLSAVLHSQRSCNEDFNLTFGTRRESSLVFITYSDLLRSNADAESDKASVQDSFRNCECEIRPRRDHIK
jgi:hypothetical protein